MLRENAGVSEDIIDVKVVNGGETNGEDQRALVGKIAQLPHKIREQLNRRLRNGEQGPELLPWLNELPAVKKVLAAHFDGKAINHQNLSAWRQGGYERWLASQRELDEIRGLKQEAQDWAKAAGGGMIRGTARMAAARMFKMIKNLEPEKVGMMDMIKLSYAISALLHAEQENDWLAHDETKVKLSDERVTIQWDKLQRDQVAIAMRVLDDEHAKAIHAGRINNATKIEMLGHRMFGKFWQMRKQVMEQSVEAPQ